MLIAGIILGISSQIAFANNYIYTEGENSNQGESIGVKTSKPKQNDIYQFRFSVNLDNWKTKGIMLSEEGLDLELEEEVEAYAKLYLLVLALQAMAKLESYPGKFTDNITGEEGKPGELLVRSRRRYQEEIAQAFPNLPITLDGE